MIGGRDMLEPKRPGVIVLETNEQNQPPFRDRRSTKILREMSYRFLAIPKATWIMKLKTFDPDLINDPSHDVVAIAEEQFKEISSRLL